MPICGKMQQDISETISQIVQDYCLMITLLRSDQPFSSYREQEYGFFYFLFAFFFLRSLVFYGDVIQAKTSSRIRISITKKIFQIRQVVSKINAFKETNKKISSFIIAIWLAFHHWLTCQINSIGKIVLMPKPFVDLNLKMEALLFIVEKICIPMLKYSI